MSWMEGTVVEFAGDNPKHRDLRKIKTHPGQDWGDQYFFHVSQARRLGYPDEALADGRRIRFEPDESDPARPRVKTFPPYSPPGTERPANTFFNPYHFIGLQAPASESLRDAETFVEEEPLHDRFGLTAPGSDRAGEACYSGRLVCRVTTEGPVVVGSTQTRPDGDEDRETEVEPFELPDPEAPDDRSRRRPAIPGSTLRGLLSSLVEAASCSALRVLPDRTFTRRADLGTESLSAVGRLEEHAGELRLRPLSLSLKEMTERSSSSRRPRKAQCRVFLKGYEKKDGRVVVRGGTFLSRRRPLSHSASNPEFWYLDLDKTHWHGSRGLTLGLLADEDPIPEAEWEGLPEDERNRYTRGVLLVLGVDGSKADNLPPTKRYEQFLPFPATDGEAEPDAGTLEIPKAVLAEFRSLLTNSFELPRGGEATDLPYLHAGRKRSQDGPPSPEAGDLVYFETDPETGLPSNLSYSAIWRRPVKGESLYQAVRLVSPDLLPLHPNRENLTVAERLFGFVEAKGKRALAGRVRVAHGLALGEPPDGGWYEEPTNLKILASPKPPSPALYFGNHGYLERRRLDLSKHPPQGRKVYLHHREADVEDRCFETGEPGEKPKLKMRVRPLKKGTSFLFHLDFLNLTRDELGWLLYAARPAPRFRHKLGLGKPLGLGRVELEPLALGFLDRQRAYSSEGLFGPRFASLEWPGEQVEWETSPVFLRRRYRAEREALAQGAEPKASFPSAEELREAVRGKIPEEVRWPLELLGDPHQVHAQVTYPLLLGQSAEGEHFRWFGENERRHKKPLPTISPGDPLPVLEHHAESRMIRSSPARGRIPRRKVAAAIQAIHVEPQGTGWLVRRAAPNSIWETYPSREQALAFARKLRQDSISQQGSVEIIVHDADGRRSTDKPY